MIVYIIYLEKSLKGKETISIELFFLILEETVHI